jgi:hypothetical protein
MFSDVEKIEVQVHLHEVQIYAKNHAICALISVTAEPRQRSFSRRHAFTASKYPLYRQ